MKKIFIILFVLIFTFAAGSSALYIMHQSKKQDSAYTVSHPFKSNIERKIVFSGRVVPRKEVDVKSQVTGVVDKIFVLPGQIVKKGEYIAQIALAPSVVQVAMLNAQLRLDAINFTNAEIEYKKQLSLFEEKLISESEYNKFLLSYNLAKETMESNKNLKSLLMAGKSNGQVIANNMITATISGMVLDIPVKEGDYIVESSTYGPSTTIASLADMTDLILEGSLEESAVSDLKIGMPIKLKISALKDQSFDAAMEFISPKGTSENGVTKYKVRASVKLNSSFLVRANYGTEAEIILEKKYNVLTINERNVIYEDKASYINILNTEEKIEKRKITTGISDGTNIEIISGVSLDDNVVEL